MNNMKEHQAQTPAQQLDNLLETMLPEIIRHETETTSTIHLYHTGDYWVAFNMSAYLLTETGMPCDTSAMQIPALPSPLIIAYTTTTVVDTLLDKDNTSEGSCEYKAITAQVASMQSYKEWYREETEIFEE